MKNQLIYSGKCKIITEGNVKAEAIISNDYINFYLVEPETGKIIEKGHDLEGKKIGGKVIVFPGDKGSSVVQLDGLYQLGQKNNKPGALIVSELSTVLVSNAIIMEIPLICDLDAEFYKTLKAGDYISINTEEGSVFIMRKAT